MKVFPTVLFCFDGHDADLERRTVSGGVALSGDEDVVAIDGGGRVFAQFTDAYLDDPGIALAWRAISAGFGDGAPIIVPLADYRHQMMGTVTLPPGGNPWWDESEFPTGETGITIAANAALRATQLTLAMESLPTPLRVGLWLSIDHATYRHRAYRIAEIVSDDGEEAVVKIRPPLREAVTVGDDVEIADPKCVMRIDGDMGSPTTLGYSEGSVRFVEDLTGSYG